MLQRIAQLAIAAPRRIIAIALLVMVACGIFGVPVANHLSAGGFQDPTSQSAQATQLLVDKFGQDQPVSIAMVPASRGMADAAFEWLDKAVAVGDAQLTGVLTEPMFDPLHGDPRWLPFLRRIGSAPEQLAKIELKVTLPQ